MLSADQARWLAQAGDCGIIVLTGNPDETDRVVGLEIGADDYLAKPFDRGELLARVRRILQRTYGYGDLANMLDATATAH